MVIDEKDVAGKWCPFARVSPHRFEGGAYNRTEKAMPDHTGCIGSKCMAWRWFLSHGDEGFCGLAGDEPVR
jgi:hypothetical protein